MPDWLFVFVGGGLGSMARWGITAWLSPQEGGFYWGTFIANIVACLILGLLMGYQIKYPLANFHRLLLMVGFCGGFSTFSTFSAEILLLLKDGNHSLALTYMGVSIISGLMAVIVGLKLFDA